MFEKLTVPTDFGALTDASLTLARRLGAKKVRLVHVVAPEFASLYEGGVVDGVTTDAAERIEHIRQKHAADGFEIETVVRAGQAVTELVADTQEWHPDAVVVGSHGRTGLPRMLLGSVTLRLLRALATPAFVVKGEVNQIDPILRIGLATDIDDPLSSAAKGFERLLEATKARGWIAYGFQREYHRVRTHEREIVDGETTTRLLTPNEFEQRVAELRNERQRKLESRAETLRQRGHDVASILLEGEPWQEITKLAEQEHFDVLVVGSHHRGLIDRVLLGSVSEKILRASACPVLVVPEEST